MGVFIIPHYFTNGVIVSPANLQSNFTAIKSELENVSNLGARSVTTDSILDANVTGAKISISSVLSDNSIVNYEYHTERLDGRDTDPVIIFDTNFVVGAVTGESDLVWDDDNWAISGGTAPTWADPPAIEMLLDEDYVSAGYDCWKSQLFKLEHSTSFNIRSYDQDINGIIVLYINYPTATTDAARITEFETNMASYQLFQTDAEDPTFYDAASQWFVNKSAKDFHQFFPILIERFNSIPDNAGETDAFDLHTFIPASTDEPAVFQIVVYKVNFNSGSTIISNPGASDEYIINELRCMPVGELPESGTYLTQISSYT